MFQKISYQTRIILFLVFFSLVVLGLFGLFYSFYTPRYEQKLGYIQKTSTKEMSVELTNEANIMATLNDISTKTKEIELTEAKSTDIAYQFWAQTQTAYPTNTATPTQTLIPTFTSTPTMTKTATLTPSFTPPPEVNLCHGSVVNRDDVNAYIYPNLSMVDESKTLIKKQEISVVARIQDDPWVLVNIDGEESWMLSSTIVLDSNCKLNVFDLSYLLGEAESTRKVLIDDTFSSNKYAWMDSSGINIFPESNNLGNDQISIDTYATDHIYSLASNLENIYDFRLITSFSRFGYNKEEASVGVLFGINGSNLLLVSVSSTCQLTVEGNGTNIFEKKLDTSICSDVNYFWIIEHSNTGELSITINSSTPVVVTLPSELSGGLDGNIGYEVSSSYAYFDFIVLTTSIK